jgi:hypothetical protein
MAAPPAIRPSRSSMRQRWSNSRTPLTIVWCAAVSTKQATASESSRIQATCSALEVSYTGTVTAPQLQIA